MAGRSVALAIASGVATFLFVAGMISTLGHEWGGFAILAGLVLGSTAGAIATAGVTAAMTGDVPDRQRRLAGAFAGFIVGLVGTVMAATWLVSLDLVSAIGVGVVAGLVLGSWGSQQGDTLHLETDS